ncbi:hypothetical protein D3C81_2065000 [compost metagenome]
MGGAVGGVEQAREALVTALGKALLDQLVGAENAAQQVVEVMGNAAAELADGFHLLGLAQGLLGLPQTLLVGYPFADVVGEQIRPLNSTVLVTQWVKT